MSTAFDEASVILPQGSGYKAGKLYGWRPDVKELQDIDVVRAAATNVASRVNSSGVREFVPANTPRWDWSEGGSCPSLLVEPQSTNLFVQDLAGSGVATQVVTVVDGTEYTVSVEGSGSIALTGAGTGTVTEGSHVTFTADGTSLTCTLTGSLDYAQVEAGAKPTSIIYTSDSTATRNKDLISKDGIASLIGQSEGTFYIEASVFDETTTNKRITFTDGTSGGTIRLVVSGKNATLGNQKNSLTAQANNVITKNVFSKIACTYSPTGLSISVDGGASINTPGDGSPDATLSEFNLHAFTTTLEFYARIRALAWLKTALTNDELEELTTP